MESRYLRNIPALTEAEQLSLSSRRVLVAGCGGLGGHILDMLLRIGIGGITAVDCDVFDPSNLNRQLLSNVSVLGRSKVDTAAEHARLVNPSVDFRAVHTRIDRENALPLVTGHDAVLDALDNIESRRYLADACDRAGIPLIHGAICGWNAQAAIAMPGKNLIDKIYPPHVAIRDKSVLSFTPALCAAMEASLCVQLLCGRPVETQTLHLVDLLNMEWNSIPL